MTSAVAVAASTVALSAHAGLAAPLSGDSSTQPRSLVVTPLTAASFAAPSDVARPQFRYWVPTPPPAGGLKEDVIRGDIADMAALGAGGVEVAALGYIGGGPNRSEAWGSQTWAKSFNTILQASEEEGLEVSATVGPNWPTRIPTVNTVNDPRASKGLYAASTVVTPGSPVTAAALPLPTGYAPGATPKLIGLVAAQCSANATCTPTTNPGANGTARTTLLDRSTARTVTVTQAGDPQSDTDNTFNFNPPATSSTNGWSVMAFWQATESGPDNGYAGPMYLVDHLSKAGASVVTDFWDDNILNYGSGDTSTRSLIDRLGGIQVFEDSLELSDRLKWTDTMVSEWATRRGYNPLLSLPALANTGAQACNTFTPTQSGENNTKAGTGMDCGVPPTFDFSDGAGVDIRRDYRQTFSDMYIENRLGHFMSWGRKSNIRIKAQPYGEPIDMGAAATVLDVPEGESLAFVNNPEYYKVIAAGAHMSGTNAVSTECCAIFGTPYATDLKKRLGYVNRAFAGGVNVNTWHGYSYPYAGNNSQQWPGNHAFGWFVDEAGGKRNPNAQHFAEASESLARTQLVLRQGAPRFDVAVYREDFGLTSVQGNGNNTGQSQGGTFNEGTIDAPDNPAGSGTVAVKTAMNAQGFTYEYVGPEHLDLKAATWDGSRLFPDRSAYKALVLNNQKDTMRLDAMQKVLAWAKDGLPVVIIGDLPTATPSLNQKAAQSASLVAATRQLRGMVGNGAYKVRRVSSEAYVPAALDQLGVQASAERSRKSPAILPVRRHSDTGDFYYLFNQSDSAVDTQISLEGDGQPYRLDHVTGTITPVPVWSSDDGRVTFDTRIEAQQAVTYVLAPRGIDGVKRPVVHAVTSTGDLVVDDAGFAARSADASRVRSTLSDGRVISTDVPAPRPVRLGETWQLSVESWTPDASTPDTTDTKRTVLPTRPVVAGDDGTLPAWRDIAGIGPDVAGIGTYSQTFRVDEGWAEGNGAFLDLGRVSDTAVVRINGTRVPVDQASFARIDIGPWLKAGQNTIEVEVASRLLNAARAAGTTGFAGLPVVDNGLMGPVRTSPYRQVALDVTPPAPPVVSPPGKVTASVSFKLSSGSVVKGTRVRATIAVKAKGISSPSGKVVIQKNGRTVKTLTLRTKDMGRRTITVPKLPKGTYRLRVVYSGNAAVKGKSSATRVLRIR